MWMSPRQVKSLSFIVETDLGLKSKSLISLYQFVFLSMLPVSLSKCIYVPLILCVASVSVCVYTCVMCVCRVFFVFLSALLVHKYVGLCMYM